jgi:hypothetical protein
VPWTGAGTYSPPAASFPEVNGTVIDAGRYNPTITDIAAGITAALAKNGENTPSANLPMGGFKHTGAADASGTGQYLTYGTVLSVGTLPFALGAVGTPSITFIGDLNTGFYSPGADQLAAATAGVARLTIDTVALTSTLPYAAPLGAVGTPSYSFVGDLNTGFYSPGADQLAMATAGVQRWIVSATGVHTFRAPSAGTGFAVEGVSTSDQIAAFSSTGAAAPYISVNGPSSITGILGTTTAVVVIGALTAHPVSFRTSNVEAMRLAIDGKWTVQAASSGTTFQVSGVAGQASIQGGGAFAGGVTYLYSLNTDNTNAASSAAVIIGVGGASAGDPYVRWDTPNIWHAASDNSDADSWILGTGTVIGAANRIRVPITGAISLIAGVYTPTSSQAFSATPTFDAGLSNVFEFSGALTANVTSMTISNPTAGQTISIRLKQDATGARTVAAPASSKISGAMGPTASAASILTLTYSSMDARWEGSWVNLPA